MAKRKGKGGKVIIPVILLIVLLLIGGGLTLGDKEDMNPYSATDAYVHFIDVGQGSSTLIQIGSKGILIDAGEDEYGDYVADYVNSCGIDTLEYVVASHPHSDHIGGLCDVLERYPAKEMIMPYLTEENTPTTRVYERLLDCIAENEIPVTASEVGDKYELDGISMEILGPAEQDDDLNNMSVICRVAVNGSSFMILGDAEKPEMKSVFAATPTLTYKSDVVAMGHHGSRTSIQKDFLSAVDADVAVISCGKDNSYNHPHEEALEYIEKENMTLYRTDYDGHVVFRCTENGYERVDSDETYR